MQENGVRFLPEGKLIELIRARSEIEHLRRIEFGGRSLFNRNAQGDYRFSHFSIQEYLVAQTLLRSAQSQERLEVPLFASEKVIRFVLDGRGQLCADKPLSLRGLPLFVFDLAGADLKGADLSGANLANANLVGADLSQADLSGANLSGAKVEGARLDFARLEGANLAGVVLTQPIQGYPFIHPLDQRVKIELVWIPAGSFQMGELDGPRVQVNLTRGFWMGKYPVTQEAFAAVTGRNPSRFRNSGLEAPVENMDWAQARAFCGKLSETLSQLRGTAGLEYRLPTEAEWEYACRAGSVTAYCFGDDESKLGEYAWYAENSGRKTHPVGQKKSNQWGLHDMHGNVWEWCHDWHGGPVTDPIGPEKGRFRVLRGGAWYYPARDCRSAYRVFDHPSNRNFIIGFRVVLASRSVP